MGINWYKYITFPWNPRKWKNSSDLNLPFRTIFTTFQLILHSTGYGPRSTPADFIDSMLSSFFALFSIKNFCFSHNSSFIPSLSQVLTFISKARQVVFQFKLIFCHLHNQLLSTVFNSITTNRTVDEGIDWSSRYVRRKLLPHLKL